MFRRAITALSVLLTTTLFTPQTYAACDEPVHICRTAGGLGQGTTLTITGCGFGERPDFHPADNKMARMFDDFNDGELVGNLYSSWKVFNPGGGACVYTRQNPRTDRLEDGAYRRKTNNLGFIYLNAGDHQEYYSSFYMRLSDGFDIKSMVSGTHQFKIIRLYSAGTNGTPKVNIYPMIGHNDGFSFAPENVSPQVMRYQLQLREVPDRPYGWHKMAVYYKKSSSPRAKDGKCQIWWDNKLIFDWYTHFLDQRNNPSYAPSKITGDFDTNGGDLAAEWNVGNYFSSASTSTWMDFDDIYMDNTLARVELGNTENFAACTITEVQPAQSWADDQVTVTINRGQFKSGETVWLYVIDRNNVPSKGLKITLP